MAKDNGPGWGERERYVTSNGARLWSVASGSGTPCVLFNGGPGCDDYLGPVGRFLSDRCEVIRFEPRGCGRSDWDGHYDLNTSLLDAETVREAYDFDRWVVAGHSAGVDMALAYALRYRERTIGGIGIAGGRIVNDRKWSEVYRGRLETVGEDNGGREFHSDPEVNRQGNETWREYCRRPALLRELAELDVPWVFINGGKDIRPSWPTQQLGELIPRAKYVEIPGAAHHIWLTHSDQLRIEFRDALNYVLDTDGKGTGQR